MSTLIPNSVWHTNSSPLPHAAAQHWVSRLQPPLNSMLWHGMAAQQLPWLLAVATGHGLGDDANEAKQLAQHHTPRSRWQVCQLALLNQQPTAAQPRPEDLLHVCSWCTHPMRLSKTPSNAAPARPLCRRPCHPQPPPPQPPLGYTACRCP